MELISSHQNTKIKSVKKLRRRKGRQKSQAFIVEGIRHVGEAVEAGVELQTVFYAPNLLTSEFALGLIDSLASKGVECQAVSADVFRSIAEKENPQGILAVARETHRQLEELTPANFPWGVALVSPQDPGNLGTILRTVDAVGASGVIILDGGVDIYNPAVIRASMGTIFWKPVTQATIKSFATWVTQHGYHVFGSSAHASLDYRQIQSYPSPRILLMGSEREGLSAEHLTLCEATLRLPMVGQATSLNLAVATGVLLYAMLACDEAHPTNLI